MRPSALLRTGAAVGVIALLSACTSGGANGTSTGPFVPTVATSAPAASADVASVNWNLGTGEPATLDPAQSAVENVSTVVANLCEGLYRWNGAYEPEPALATAVEKPDKQTWVFTLRQGVTFWDGTPMTADDVVYSIKRVLDPETASPWAAWASSPATVTAVDSSTVKVQVEKFDSLIENYFQTPAFVVVSKAYAEKAGKEFGTQKAGVMCTGPYKLGDWASGQSISLTRNDAWWDVQGKPKVAALKFSFVTDAAGQTAGLVKGDLDGQFGVQVTAYDQLNKAGNLLFGASLAPTFLSALDLQGPMGNPKVRQALAKVVDYQGIVSTIYRQSGSVLKALVPPSAYGYAKDVFQPAYDAIPEPKQDLEAAKQLVAESGVGSTPVVLAYYSDSGDETKAATAIAAAANSVGLKVELKPLDSAKYFALFSSEEARAGYDVFLLSGYLDYPDPLQYYQYFTIGSYYNFTGYDNKEYTAFVNAALADDNPQSKAESIVQAQSIMNEDLVNIPILTTFVSVFYGKKLGGYTPVANYLYTPWATDLAGA